MYLARVSKPEERTAARLLRSEGIALKVIAKRLHVSPGSAYLWCKDIQLSEEQHSRLNGQPVQMARLRQATKAKSEKARALASNSFKRGIDKIGVLADRDLLLLGVGLYWGEGCKRQVGTISLANMDPAVHAVFLRWAALLGLSPDRVVARLHINEGADLDAEKQWWADRLSLKPACFRKTITRLSPTSQLKTKRENYHGVLTLGFYNTQVWHQVIGMVSRAGFEPSVTAVRGQRPEPLDERDGK